MKVRKGFVSNSSTCSFTIYGAWLDRNDVMKALKEKQDEDYLKTIEKWKEDYTEDGEEFDEEEIDDLSYFFECVFGNLFTHYDWDTGDVALGEGFASMDDDETKAEFKKRIEESLKEKLGTLIDNVKFDIISHEYQC